MNAREEILTNYKTYPNSDLIRSPGKFEGEPLWAVYFWNLAMDGSGDVEWDDDDTEVTTFQIQDEDRELFPELTEEGITAVSLWEDSQGFVHTETH